MTAAPVHLVEVGVAWPPDTFLRHKLAGLARRGFRVTVVAASGGNTGFRLPGVEVVWMPARTESSVRMALGACRDCLRLGLARRGRLSGVRTAAARPGRKGARARLRWLRRAAALASLEPDLVHFEWETAAVRYLPLVDLWRCPMVMSCRGGLDLYARAPSHSKGVASVAEAFGRAAAVHCVSEAAREEATRYGLDPDKAQVIRSGIDIGAFAPSVAVIENTE